MSPLCLVDSDKSLFGWNDKTVEELRKRDRDQRNKHIVAILYLWELCDTFVDGRRGQCFREFGFESPGYCGLITKNVLVVPQIAHKIG